MHGDEDNHGHTAHVEIGINMRCEMGYTISHIYKLPVKVYPFYAPFFCMVYVLSRVIPQRMSIINASPRFRHSWLGENPLGK